LTTEARIDTGFNGGLTFPPDLVASLGLVSEFSDTIILANGDLINVATYRATIMLDGTGRAIPVFATGDFPLLGMLSLTGYRICINMHNGGAVTIKAKTRKKR
jgi:predicted aspartyl protease